MSSHAPSEGNLASSEVFMSPHERIGLGRAAVDQQHESVGRDAAPKEQKKLVESAREQLESLDAEHRQKMNEFILAHPMSRWLNEQIGMDESIVGDEAIDDAALVVEALLRKDQKGTYAVSDEVFLHFLQWHNHMIMRNQEWLDGKAEKYKDEFKSALAKAIEDGWMPQSVSKRFAFLDAVMFIADDGFDSTFRYEDGSYMSLGDDKTGEITMAPDLLEDTHLRFHELTHPLAGRDRLPKPTPEYRPPHTTGLHRLFGEPKKPLFMNEAMTEHISSALHYGKADTTDPLAFVRRNDIYYSERQLLHVLSTSGLQRIDIRDFIAAHIEDQTEAEEKGDNSAQAELQRKLIEAFPFIDIFAETKALESREDIVRLLMKITAEKRQYVLRRPLRMLMNTKK